MQENKTYILDLSKRQDCHLRCMGQFALVVQVSNQMLLKKLIKFDVRLSWLELFGGSAPPPLVALATAINPWDWTIFVTASFLLG